MRKKIQIFISSTYTDLIEERQAAVEAILSAGHIPAGMELFAAGNESQLDTVRRWIDESDVYMLILGGRYGSIEQKSQKSYTHLEYEYALQKGIPLFAIVLSESALQKKVKKCGQQVLELDNRAKYTEFREIVLSKICKFFEDTKDIKLAVHEALSDFQNRYQFSGWISGKEFNDNERLLFEGIQFLQRLNTSGLLNKLSPNKNLPKPLSLREEAFYLGMLAKGKSEVKEILVERNLWQVVNIAREYESENITINDLVSIGTIGLIMGVNTFNNDLHMNLTNYLSQCIEREIQKHLSRNLTRRNRGTDNIV